MTDAAVKHAGAPVRRRTNYLPYLLSLPALLVCIGIFDSLRHRCLLFPAALPSEPAGDARVHLVPELHQLFHRQRILAHRPGIARIYGADGRGRARVRPGHRNASAEADPDQQHRLDPASSASHDGAGDRRAHVEADDQPELRHPLLFCAASRLQQFQMGVRSKHRFVHRRARRRLGLHAFHHDFASRRPALSADATVRSRRARWRS